ncbi:MAG: hypothetical protein MUC48_24140, partial [Leptolyngbya sp. Prado105]|nr:hypothetical protein [Leptolyngbya sp. Prado105]
MSDVDCNRVWLRRWVMVPGLILGLSALSIVPSEVSQAAPTIAQTAQTSEIDRAIAQGSKLYDEGSAESLRKAISVFEKALQLSRSAKASDKQARSLR